jgi:hypothetical protein
MYIFTELGKPGRREDIEKGTVDNVENPVQW